MAAPWGRGLPWALLAPPPRRGSSRRSIALDASVHFLLRQGILIGRRRVVEQVLLVRRGVDGAQLRLLTVFVLLLIAPQLLSRTTYCLAGRTSWRCRAWGLLHGSGLDADIAGLGDDLLQLLSLLVFLLQALPLLALLLVLLD